MHQLISQNTVETRINEMQAKKRALTDALFNPEKAGPAMLSESEIMSLFKPL